jgi:hypothetical protein
VTYFFFILHNEPTNAQLNDKLLFCSYMFRHIVPSSREFVVSTLLSYISMSMQLLVIQFKISHMFIVVESQCLKPLKYYNCPSYNKTTNIFVVRILPQSV